MIELLQYEFIRNAIIAALLVSVACGIVGVYVVVKRIVFISGGIAHAAFGGIGLGYFLGMNPVLGAIPFSIASALSMGIVTKRTKIPEDTAIGILWVIGMAIGVIFIGLSPGYAPNLFTYLFGNILMVPIFEIRLMLLLDAVIVSVMLFFYKEFQAISFDEEYATTLGLPTERLYLLLLCLIALSVVVLIRVVGIILVIAMLTIPAAMSKGFTNNLSRMILLTTFLCSIFFIGGLCFSYIFDLPSGATIVLFSAFIFSSLCFLRKKTSNKETYYSKGIKKR